MNNILLIFLACVSFAYSNNQSTVPCELTYTIMSSQLNVRVQPNNKSQIMHVLNKDTQGCILSSKKEWVKIEEGWISKKFIKETKSNNKVHANPVKTRNSYENIIGGLIVIGMILLLIFYSIRTVYIAFRDKYYMAMLVYLIATVYFLFIYIYPMYSPRILYTAGIVIVVWFTTYSLAISILEGCQSCGYTKLKTTDKVLLDTGISQDSEGKKYHWTEHNIEYFCEKCGQYSNYIKKKKEYV